MRSTSKLLVGIVSLLLCNSLFAQNNINLKIVHKLSVDDFQLNQTSQNNQQHKFNVSRLEYYISEISITHDGGQQTSFDSLWVLVNASTATEVALGSENITDVESISFSIGVDQAHNHLDPSAWPSSHPLAPKNPSMHWGWTSGYRFVAMEGDAGETLSQSYELHALGDNNYFQTTVDADGVVSGSEVTITLYADYAEALHDIDISSGLILHSETGEAKDLLENFRDYVFSATGPIDTTTGISNIALDHDIHIAPNPATDGTICIHRKDLTSGALNIEVFDITGKRIYSAVSGASISRMNIPGLNRGMYFVRVNEPESRTYITKKISVL